MLQKDYNKKEEEYNHVLNNFFKFKQEISNKACKDLLKEEEQQNQIKKNKKGKSKKKKNIAVENKENEIEEKWLLCQQQLKELQTRYDNLLAYNSSMDEIELHKINEEKWLLCQQQLKELQTRYDYLLAYNSSMESNQQIAYLQKKLWLLKDELTKENVNVYLCNKLGNILNFYDFAQGLSIMKSIDYFSFMGKIQEEVEVKMSSNNILLVTLPILIKNVKGSQSINIDKLRESLKQKILNKNL